MFKYVLIGLVLLCLEVLLVAILAADGQVNRAIERERLLAAAWLGETVEQPWQPAPGPGSTGASSITAS